MKTVTADGRAGSRSSSTTPVDVRTGASGRWGSGRRRPRVRRRGEGRSGIPSRLTLRGMSRGERYAGARRDWGADDSGCTILHVDMDAFFAAVELLDRPDLVGRPVIVGADRRGVVLSATYEARSYGVHSAMPMARARALCPSAVVLPPHHDTYARVSRQVMAILAEVTPVMEKVSIDEAFLDVAGAVRRLGPPARIAAAIRSRVHAELGVPASVGVAATKFVAKLASSHAKPDGLLLVPRAATVPFLHSLPVGALWGVGDKTRERLHRSEERRVGGGCRAGRAV